MSHDQEDQAGQDPPKSAAATAPKQQGEEEDPATQMDAEEGAEGLEEEGADPYGDVQASIQDRIAEAAKTFTQAILHILGSSTMTELHQLSGRTVKPRAGTTLIAIFATGAPT